MVIELFNLAQQRHRSGDWLEAEKSYRQILSIAPKHPGATHLLGLIYFQQGRPLEAYPLMKESIELDPCNGVYYANFGALCRKLGRVEEAAEAYRQSLAIAPTLAVTWNNLGNLQADMERFDEAISSFRHAVQLDRNYSEPQFNLAKTLPDIGDFLGAFAEYRKALATWPDAREHSNLLLDLHYPDGQSPEDIFNEHLQFNRLYAEPLSQFPLRPPSDRLPDRLLRIGYVSADFRRHPLARLVEPLLANHDRAQFSVFCYSDAPKDEVLGRLRTFADCWIETEGWSDEQLAKRINDDHIDILFDLAGHTRGNRLLVFALKPAPIQITHLGYPDTTGLSAMDYRFTDPFRDPPGAANGMYSERSYHLSYIAWCYQPIGSPLPAVALPALGNGHVTFGCLNNFRKITPEMVRLWSQILHQSPTARLALSIGAVAGSPSHGRDRLLRQFSSLGISESRLQLIARCSQAEYLQHLQRIDIALDTFPFNGGVTTLDTLWTSVPVVTLCGKTYVSRVGSSLLSQVGLGDLIATTPEQYVNIAVDLAQDIPRLSQLHDTLHNRFKESPLMNGPAYARDVEAALRQMWREFCGR